MTSERLLIAVMGLIGGALVVLFIVALTASDH
jgi:hypothetical protein